MLFKPIILHSIPDSYIAMPSSNPAGLTIVVKLKVDRDAAVRYKDERFIFDSGGWLGHGVSLFVMNGKLSAVVGRRGQVWLVRY